MSLQSADQECAAVAVAPRLSLANIEAAIGEVYHMTGASAVKGHDVPDIGPHGHPLHLLSICLVVMRNGFTIIGKSAPASAANFNAGLGRKLAYEDAIRQIWPLMGFNLRQRLHDEAGHG